MQIHFILCKSTTTADCHSSLALSNLHICRMSMSVYIYVKYGKEEVKVWQNWPLHAAFTFACLLSSLSLVQHRESPSFNTFALNFIMFALCLWHLPSINGFIGQALKQHHREKTGFLWNDLWHHGRVRLQ